MKEVNKYEYELKESLGVVVLVGPTMFVTRKEGCHELNHSRSEEGYWKGTDRRTVYRVLCSVCETSQVQHRSSIRTERGTEVSSRETGYLEEVTTSMETRDTNLVSQQETPNVGIISCDVCGSWSCNVRSGGNVMKIRFICKTHMCLLDNVGSGNVFYPTITMFEGKVYNNDSERRDEDGWLQVDHSEYSCPEWEDGQGEKCDYVTQFQPQGEDQEVDDDGSPIS